MKRNQNLMKSAKELFQTAFKTIFGESWFKKSLSKRASLEIEKKKILIVLTIVSGLLAGFAINLNNNFILLGAMLIAPFLNPIISMMVFLFCGKFLKLLRALLTLVLITTVIFFINFILIKLIPASTIPNTNFLRELFYVNHFFVAVLLGAFGMFLWLWPKIPALSSAVSIAISLAPPLAFSARFLAEGNLELFWSFLQVFVLNLLGVMLGTMLTLFYKQRVET